MNTRKKLRTTLWTSSITIEYFLLDLGSGGGRLFTVVIGTINALGVSKGILRARARLDLLRALSERMIDIERLRAEDCAKK